MKEITATFSQQFIEVLDAICDKIGVAIDWTADNCLPQVLSVLHRYRTYIIIRHSLIALIGLILIITGTFFIVKIIKQRIRKSGCFYSSKYEQICDAAYALLFVSAAMIMVGIDFVIDSIGTILEWSIVPEIQYLNLIKHL